MMHRTLLLLGVAALAIAWSGALPRFLGHSFTAHMAMHMTVVAVAAPLLAVGVAGSRADPSLTRRAWFAPMSASLVELVIVWGWHAPALHSFARGTTAGLALEQASFLVSGLLVWLSAFGGRPNENERHAAGIIGLLLTSMHMTLLGALLGLGTRALYTHSHHGGNGLDISPLADQHIGGAIMLLAGGSAYLIGGLVLMARLLRIDDSALGREQR
ncbi:MAG: cytochrome c oxidase assembly protein [Gammaproteobacteria bacterium]|nr:cytochrome c oxidase assembly protein [Gammaproteobacteria bacterium]